MKTIIKVNISIRICYDDESEIAKEKQIKPNLFIKAKEYKLYRGGLMKIWVRFT